MPRVATRALKILSASLVGTAVLGTAVPAFAAPAAKPLTANQIAKKANADFKAASSVEFYGKQSIMGQTVTITETVAPQGCQIFENLGAGATLQVLNVGASQWVKLSDQAWQQLGYTGTDLGYVEGKWVTVAAFLQAFGLQNVPTGPDDCHSHEASGLPSTGWTLSKKLIKVSGQRAWQLSRKLNDAPLRAAVSDTKKPEILAITLGGTTTYLSHYNARVTLAAPPADDVLTSLPPVPAPVPSPTASIGRAARAGLARVVVAGLSHAGDLLAITR